MSKQALMLGFGVAIQPTPTVVVGLRIVTFVCVRLGGSNTSTSAQQQQPAEGRQASLLVAAS